MKLYEKTLEKKEIFNGRVIHVTEEVAELEDGTSVVIYNPNSKKGMTSDVLVTDWYLAPEDVTIEDDKAVDPA